MKFLRTLYYAYQYTSLLKLITSCYCIPTIFLSFPYFFLAQEAVVEEQNSETDNIKVL